MVNNVFGFGCRFLMEHFLHMGWTCFEEQSTDQLINYQIMDILNCKTVSKIIKILIK